jgi:hypothetical protein
VAKLRDVREAIVREGLLQTDHHSLPKNGYSPKYVASFPGGASPVCRRRRCGCGSYRSCGRLEHRTLTATTSLSDYLDWPGETGLLHRSRTHCSRPDGHRSRLRHHVAPPLTSQCATLRSLLRGHWLESMILFAAQVPKLSASTPRSFWPCSIAWEPGCRSSGTRKSNSSGFDRFRPLSGVR